MGCSNSKAGGPQPEPVPKSAVINGGDTIQNKEADRESKKGATRRFNKTETIAAVRAVGIVGEGAQETMERHAAVQEGVEENDVLVDAGHDILRALGKDLSMLEGVRDVVSDFIGVAQGALDVIGSIPFVAPVARLASLVVQQVAAEKATRAMCKGLIPLCACAFKVLEEARQGLMRCEREVEALQEALEEALDLVHTVRDRSFFRRVLTAGSDAEGVKEAGEKVENALREVVASAAVQALQTAGQALEEARGVVRRLRSAEEMREELLWDIGGDSASEDEVLRRLEGLDEAEWEGMWQKLSAGEKIAIAEARDAHRRIDELMMKQVVNVNHPEVENLPPKLREMWVRELGSAPYNSVKWDDVHDLMPDLKWHETDSLLKDWGCQRLQSSDFLSFLAESVKTMLAPDGDLWVRFLAQKATRAKIKYRLEKEQIEVAHVLDVILQEGPRGKTSSAAIALPGALPGCATRADESPEPCSDGHSGEETAASVRGVLEAHDFEADCASRAAGFMAGTREWLLERIRQWAKGEGQEGAKRVFALISLPGMGKTAFTARASEMLREEGVLLGGHFIRVGDESRTDPRRVIQSLAVQVAEALGGGVAMAVKKAAREMHEGATIWELAERLLVEPMGTVDAHAGVGPTVVVIDALDEGGSESSSALLSVLSRLIGALPGWVKALVTTRPEPYIMRALVRHEPFTLEPTGEQNREDLRAFIGGSLSKELDKEVREEVVKAIEEKSEGVIGYVAAVMAMVREGMVRKMEALADGLAEVTVGALPRGLTALYAEYMERQFGGLKEAERRVVKERMLPALVVAAEPLAVSDLERLALLGGDDVAEEVARRAVEAKGSLFPTGEDGLVRPFHKSVLDWMGQKESGEWFVEATTGHRVHALTWRRVVEGINSGADHGICAETLGTYGSRYAISHAVEWGDAEAIEAMCTSLEIIRGGVEAGAVKRLITDVGRCRRAVRQAARASMGRVEQTLRWLREFGSVLAQDGHGAPLAARVAPPDTWMRQHAERELGGVVDRDGVVPLSGGMEYLGGDIILHGHANTVCSAVFSPSGDTLLTASHDNTARLWDATTGELKAVLRGHTGKVNGAVFSPSGDTVCTASEDGTSRLWDVTTGEVKVALEGHTGPVSAAAFSPEGGTICTASVDATARLWEAQTGELRAVLEGHTLYVISAVFSPCGELVCTTSWDKSARLWEAKTGRLVFLLEGHSWKVNTAVFSPSGGTICTISEDRSAWLWDVSTGKVKSVLEGHTGTVRAAVFSPSGDTVWTVSKDTTARQWDASTGEVKSVLEGHTGTVDAAALSPEGDTICTGSGDGTARLWDVTTGELKGVLEGHTKEVNAVVFSPSGDAVCTASCDGTARVWDATAGHRTPSSEAPALAISSIVSTPSGDTLCTVSDEKAARLWDATTGELKATLAGYKYGDTNYCDFRDLLDRPKKRLIVGGPSFTPLSKGADVAAINREGDTVCTTFGDTTARLWDGRTGEMKAVLDKHTGIVFGAAFSPTGDVVCTVSGDDTAMLWNARTGELRDVLKGHKCDVTSVVFSPASGDLVCTGSQDHTARLWDVNSGKVKSKLKGHSAAITGVVFSQAGDLVCTTSTDMTARVWDARSGKLKTAMNGHAGPITSASFSPSGSMVCTMSQDRTAQLWDAATGELKIEQKGQKAMAFSPAGDSICLACDDNTVRVWSVSSGKLLGCLPVGFVVLDISFVRDGTLMRISGRNAAVDRCAVVAYCRVPEDWDAFVSRRAAAFALMARASCRAAMLTFKVCM